jgi:hypothetical protein
MDSHEWIFIPGDPPLGRRVLLSWQSGAEQAPDRIVVTVVETGENLQLERLANSWHQDPPGALPVRIYELSSVDPPGTALGSLELL